MNKDEFENKTLDENDFREVVAENNQVIDNNSKENDNKVIVNDDNNSTDNNNVDKSENGDSSDKSNEDEYEKICYVCRRPESKAGTMIDMRVEFVCAQIVCRRVLIVSRTLAWIWA